MIALGYSLWRSTRIDADTQPASVDGPRVTPAGVE
jgi:hypothetical protein